MNMLKQASQKKMTSLIVIFLIIVSGFLLFNQISYLNRHHTQNTGNIEVIFC
jgi:hypothetical protein